MPDELKPGAAPRAETVAAGSAAPTVAVVVPCYRSAASINELADRLAAAMAAAGIPYELLLVDDASPDNVTWPALVEVKRRHGAVVRAFRLARNVGQHGAIVCGLGAIGSAVKAVVTMDDDLQHRPEDVPALLAALDAGADVAIGAFDDKRHAGWRNLGGRVIDASLRSIFGLPREMRLTSFRAVRRFVAEDVVAQRGTYVYLTAAILASSARVANVPVVHEPRRAGSSGYSLVKSLTLVANLLLVYSRLPFLLVAGVCVLSLLVSAALTVWVLVLRLHTGDLVPGWTSTMLMMALQTSAILAALGLLVLYASRTHRLLNGIRTAHRIADVA